MTRLSLIVALALTGCGQKTSDAPTAKTPANAATPSQAAPQTVVSKASLTKATARKSPQKAKKKTPKASPQAPVLTLGIQTKLPAADRVFAVTLKSGPAVLGARFDQLWLAMPTADGKWDLKWSLQGPGTAHKVVAGDVGDGEQIYVAWGVGRGFLKAPLVLQTVDSKTGKAKDLWRNAGQRNEAAHLSIADVNGDGTLDLAFAYYASKYMIRTRHHVGGTFVEGAEIRMATSRDYSGAVPPLEAVGRVYGDARGLAGDLTVYPAQGSPIKIPTDNGVRAVLWPGCGVDGLLFSDGWLANYGKLAKAQLKLTTANADAKPQLIGTSGGEFTFFDLYPRCHKKNGQSQFSVYARGNKKVWRFTAPTTAGQPWVSRSITDIQPILNVAVGSLADGRDAVFVPDPKAVRVVPVQN